MQSVSVTCMQSAPPKAAHTAVQAGSNIAETVSDILSSSRELRNSSVNRITSNDTQFTAFLQNDGALNTFSPEERSAIQLPINEEQSKKTEPADLLDICGLLMQLTMSSPPIQGQNVPNGNLPETNTTTISGLSSVLAAGSEAADEIALAGETQTASGLQQSGESVEAVLGNIADSIAAMKNEQPADAAGGQTGAASAGVAVVNDTAPSYALNDISGKTDNQKLSSDSKTPVSATIRDEPGNVTASDLTAEKRITGTVPAGDGSESKSWIGAFNIQNKKEDNDAGTAVNVLQQAVADLKFNDEAAVKAAAVEKALNKFADDLRSIKGGSQEIKIVLEPESLGVLTISVLKTENGISAKIRSEDKEVVAAITDQVQKLISSMQNKGINVKEVDVAYSQTEQNMSFLNHGFSHSREDTSKGYAMPRNRSTESETPETDPWQGYYGGTSGDTTVDYRI